MKPKRRRAPTSPLELANSKTDEDFIADYLQHGSDESSWVTSWTHPRTSTEYSISLVRPDNLSQDDLTACFQLIEQTSRKDYENSAGKWQPLAKLKEMRSPELRYILVKDKNSNIIRGFTSLMPTYEEGQPVIYCYEIHLHPELQGTGLGSLLMGFHSTVAANLPPITKVMLTCFLSNHRGLDFYKRLGFEKDDISPEPRKLRYGKIFTPDYVILSKTVRSTLARFLVADTRPTARHPSLADVEYEPIWGVRLMRARAKMFDEAGFSLDGCASQDLGFVWAANANAIPVAMWVLLHVLLSQNLPERVMGEGAECFDKTKGLFDLSALCSKPLLNGVYLEALRYCVATSSARNPVADDSTFCGWKIPRDALMLSIAWFGGRDAKFWNTGRTLPNGKMDHPVDTFWAERFLEYPDDPASGPVRKPNDTIYRSAPKKSERHAQQDRTAKAIGHSPALQGYFYPYGGGSRICPGRHLAKQEILVAVAIMLDEFEIELIDPVLAKKARPDPKMFPTGAIAPDRKLLVRIRRRRRGEVKAE